MVPAKEIQFYFMPQSPQWYKLQGEVPKAGIQPVCTRTAGLVNKILKCCVVVGKNPLLKPFSHPLPSFAVPTHVLKPLAHPLSLATLLNRQGSDQEEPACALIRHGGRLPS